jgi:hypothetical protein
VISSNNQHSCGNKSCKNYYNLSQQAQHAPTTHLSSLFDLSIHDIASNVWYLLFSIEKLPIIHLCPKNCSKD